MDYKSDDGTDYVLNLIDTPGHVDFTYEVSRALEACEGAILVVDAAQGIEAQTISNLLLAMELDLEIIPVLNKVDLPGANPEAVAGTIENLIGEPAENIARISAKTGSTGDVSFSIKQSKLPDQKIKVTKQKKSSRRNGNNSDLLLTPLTTK